MTASEELRLPTSSFDSRHRRSAELAGTTLVSRETITMSKPSTGKELSAGGFREFSQLIEKLSDSAGSAFGATPAPGNCTTVSEVPLFAQQPRPLALTTNNPPTPVKPKKKQQKER